MKILIIAFSFLISASVFSQDIVNKLVKGASFIIKDVSNNYFT